MNAPIYIFAGGGSGGHLYPGLAVAERLTERQPHAQIVFACSDRPIDRRILDPLSYAVVRQPVRPLPRRLGGWLGFLRGWRASAKLARDMVRDLRPAAVLGLGGFAAAPVVRAASRGGVRTALLNPDAVPGMANRSLARRADVIFTQFADSRGYFPLAVRRRIRRVGCPVRQALLEADRGEARRFFGLAGDCRVLLVLGGSQGAASINRGVAALHGDLEAYGASWEVLHVTGKVEPEALPAPGRLHIRRIEYCERMDLAYAAADLALCRGGASTIGELIATRTASVILPYPYHRDRHQQLNARALADAGAAVLCDDAGDPELNAQTLRAALLPILDDAARLRGMQEAAEVLTPGRAAQDVASWLAGRPAAG